MLKTLSALAVCLLLAFSADAQGVRQTKGNYQDKFRQLDEVLPTPNVYRTASGAPGHRYWQQEVDYIIDVTVDEDTKVLTGSEEITYTNNSPDTLRYLWVQLDQNRFAKHSDAYSTLTASSTDRMGYAQLNFMRELEALDGGHKIAAVRDRNGNPLDHTIVDTMMRIDLAQPLKSGQAVRFSIDWSYNIPEGRALNARGGWEKWERDGNLIFFIAQWFPRLASYNDTDGWNTKGFLGGGEFSLEFGDYDVSITVPADHIVSSTGELQNPDDVLTQTQQERLEKARTSEEPIFIVTPDEALTNEKSKAKGTKTWRFKAEKVRDFAFASSRKFVWDAAGHTLPESGRTVLAMSFYPEEGMPLWDKYSTHAILHTLETYSRYAFEYPYPVAQSVLGPIGGGMEYPMITSNGPRVDIDEETGERTYTRGAKNFLIGVVIHEIGHIYFPMVVNSDERNWTWMDEGINSFLQTMAEQEWSQDFPSRRGQPRQIVDYMISSNQVPIMTQSDSILQFGNNAYAKPAIALQVLRETILGRDLFDFAFREYARRWKFKRPNPADFFRTMEDAAGRDLDWFWRGWFYSTDHVDISIDGVTAAKVDTKNPDVEEPLKRQEDAEAPKGLLAKRNQSLPKYVDRFPELLDFYNENDEFTVTEKMRSDYAKMLEGLDPRERELLDEDSTIYFIDFTNHGGLVMPVLLTITYADGETEELRIPAEIWRRNARKVTKVLVRERDITAIEVDRENETADADMTNNRWPAEPVRTRLELFKRSPSRNMMKEVRDAEKTE